MVLHGEHRQVLALPQGPADPPEVDQVIGADEQQTQTLSGGAGGASAAVDIRLRRARNLESRQRHRAGETLAEIHIQSFSRCFYPHTLTNEDNRSNQNQQKSNDMQVI